MPPIPAGEPPRLPAGSVYLPVGRIVERSQAFVPEGGGYAVVLLKRGTANRGPQACAELRKSMDTRVGPVDGRPMSMDGVLVYERPVYWPVTVRTQVVCSAMLQYYDFDRAMVSLQRVPNWDRLGRGPFIVVRKAIGSQAGFFDFSSVATADFDEQFAAVVNYMSQRDDVWSPSFYYPATFRQSLRRYVKERPNLVEVIAGLIDLIGDDG